MKKRRGKVLNRLCRSSYYCGSRNSYRENPMKTEEHLEPTAVFIQRVTAAVSETERPSATGLRADISQLGRNHPHCPRRRGSQSVGVVIFLALVPARHGGSAHRESQPI